MIEKRLRAIASIILATLWLAACTPSASPMVVPTLTPQVIQTQTASREAKVQSVAIQMMNTDPTQVQALVRGVLTEACAKLGES
jgi:hypothetical protein